MHQAKKIKTEVPLAERTVGVLDRNDAKMQKGYTLFCASQETYLIDEDGRVVNEWRSSRPVFCAYLLPNGNLLRDGSENVEAPCFQAGGAAGFVEEVTWDNEPVWSYAVKPYTSFLAHHDLEPMPNGNVLLLCWERKSKEQALEAGRRPDLIPDGEVWDNLVMELKPDGKGGASVVWKSMWDHLVQDFDPKRANYGDVAAHPELFDINFCPPGGKNACRNRDLLESGERANPSQLASFGKKEGCKTGEKDWLHINSVSYDRVRDLILMSVNIASEVLIIDHSVSTLVSTVGQGHFGGNYNRGGDILYRFGNPQVSRQGTCKDQFLFNQHSANFLRGGPGEGHVLLFNNGRAPDRHWSSIDEYDLTGRIVPREAPPVITSKQAPVWSFGPAIGRKGSFYCTHISGCQRLENGNTLITLGPQGILVEVTSDGEEVWRYVSPVANLAGAVARVRQGEQRTNGRFSLFRALRIPTTYPAFRAEGRVLAPGRALEA